jgi:hypothetical protein
LESAIINWNIKCRFFCDFFKQQSIYFYKNSNKNVQN